MYWHGHCFFCSHDSLGSGTEQESQAVGRNFKPMTKEESRAARDDRIAEDRKGLVYFCELLDAAQEKAKGDYPADGKRGDGEDCVLGDERALPILLHHIARLVW